MTTIRPSAAPPRSARPGRRARHLSSTALVAVAAAALAAAAIAITVEPAGRAVAAPRVPARPSPGCQPGQPGHSGGDQQGVPFPADGESGAYTEEIPPAAGAGFAPPVVFDLHGYEEPGPLQVTLSGLGRYGKGVGFVTVTPWIAGRPVPRWNSTAGSADLAWFGALLTHIEAASCVDENRVFVTGISNGAFMTSLIACHYSSRVAAVAAVAGILAETPCRTRRPVPVVAFHGTADPDIHYDGSPSKVARSFPNFDGRGTITSEEEKQFGTRGIFSSGPSIPDEAAKWADRNGCSGGMSSVRIALDITLLSWSCPHGADVELYRIQGGGHTWPGSTESATLSSLLGPTSFSISADRTMWRFFRAHPLTPAD